MHNAKIIFLNGPSSSGKSSIAKILQQNLDEYYLHIGIDKLIEMMPPKSNNWENQEAVDGFWFTKFTDQENHELASIQIGPYAAQICNLLRNIVLLMANEGFNIIVDEVCVSKVSFDLWVQTLSPFTTYTVGVFSDTKVLESREISRGDRMLGSARYQNLTVHQDYVYDVTINSDLMTLEECALKIMNAVQNS